MKYHFVKPLIYLRELAVFLWYVVPDYPQIVAKRSIRVQKRSIRGEMRSLFVEIRSIAMKKRSILD